MFNSYTQYLTPFFAYEPLRRVVICLHCQHAVNPKDKSLKTHLKSCLEDTSKADISSYPQQDQIPVNVIDSKHEDRALAEQHGFCELIKVYNTGYLCRIPVQQRVSVKEPTIVKSSKPCGCCFLQLSSLREHTKTAHQISTPTNLIHYTYPTAVSTLFQSPAKYYAVTVPPSKPSSGPDPEKLKLHNEAYQNEKYQQNIRNALVPVNADRRDVSIWLNRTQWLSVFQALDMNAMGELASKELRNQDPPAYEHIVEAVEAVVEECQARAFRQPHFFLRHFKRVSAGEDKQQGFRLVTEESLRNYLVLWVAFILFTVRSATDANYSVFTPGHVGDTARAIHELVVAGDQADLTELKELIRAVSRESIRQKVVESSCESLLGRFLGARGWQRLKQRWSEPWEHRHSLSACVYMMRLFAIDEVLEQEAKRASVNETSQRSSKSVMHEPDSIDEAAKLYTASYLHVSSAAPFSYIQDLRTLARTLGSNDVGAPSVLWRPDRQALFYNGHEISLAGLTEAIHKTLKQAEVLFGQLMCGGVELLHRRSPTLFKDSFNYAATGHNFVHLSPDMAGEVGPDAFVRRAAAYRPSIFAATCLPELFSSAAVQDYQHDADRLLGLLATLIHLTGGPPARASEITSVKHSNDPAGLRNVLLHNGLVMIVPGYNKSTAQTEQTRVIARFLPLRVSRLVVGYIADVLPVLEYMADYTGRNKAESEQKSESKTTQQNRYLFSHASQDGKQWTAIDYSETISDTLRNISSATLGVQALRHVLISIDKELLQSGQRQGSSEDEHMANTLMAGHTRHVEEHHYALQPNDLLGLNNRSLKLFFCVSRHFHALWDLIGEDEEGIHSPGEKDGRWTVNALARVRKLHATGSDEDRSAKKRRIISVTAAEPPRHGSNETLSRCAPMTSTAVAQDAATGKEDGPLVFENDNTLEDRLRAGLERIHGPGANFRDGQKEALVTVMRHDQDCLIVMSTGSGKSHLVTLTAMLCPAKVTIVVAPFVSLQSDLARRLRTQGIQCIIWSAGAAATAAVTSTVVLVTPEASNCNTFRLYIQQLIMEERLARVVIDECHVYVDDADWRTTFTEMEWLRRANYSFQFQRVFLTGTLPMHTQNALFDSMGVTHHSCSVVRRTTARTRINLAITVYSSSSRALWHYLLPCVSTFVEVQRRRSVEQQKKMVVFVKSKRLLLDIVARLQSEAIPTLGHHSELCLEDREDLVSRFRENGGALVMVCTTGYSNGVDNPRIGSVVAVGAFSLISFYQQVGRIRLASGGFARLLIDEHELTALGRGVCSGAKKGADKAALVGLCTTTSCRNAVMSSYLDGRYDARCESLFAMCDNCVAHNRAGFEMLWPEGSDDRALAAVMLGRAEPGVCTLYPSSPALPSSRGSADGCGSRGSLGSAQSRGGASGASRGTSKLSSPSASTAANKPRLPDCVPAPASNAMHRGFVSAATLLGDHNTKRKSTPCFDDVDVSDEKSLRRMDQLTKADVEDVVGWALRYCYEPAAATSAEKTSVNSSASLASWASSPSWSSPSWSSPSSSSSSPSRSGSPLSSTSVCVYCWLNANGSVPDHDPKQVCRPAVLVDGSIRKIGTALRHEEQQLKAECRMRNHRFHTVCFMPLHAAHKKGRFTEHCEYRDFVLFCIACASESPARYGDILQQYGIQKPFAQMRSEEIDKAAARLAAPHLANSLKFTWMAAFVQILLARRALER